MFTEFIIPIVKHVGEILKKEILKMKKLLLFIFILLSLSSIFAQQKKIKRFHNVQGFLEQNSEIYAISDLWNLGKETTDPFFENLNNVLFDNSYKNLTYQNLKNSNVLNSIRSQIKVFITSINPLEMYVLVFSIGNYDSGSVYLMTLTFLDDSSYEEVIEQKSSYDNREPCLSRFQEKAEELKKYVY